MVFIVKSDMTISKQVIGTGFVVDIHIILAADNMTSGSFGVLNNGVVDIGRSAIQVEKSAGISIAARIAMMAITTSSSMRVKR